MEEDDQTFQFLMWLNESYTGSRGNDLMISPLPSFAKVYSLLIHEEKQQEVQANAQLITESASFYAGNAHFQNQPSNSSHNQSSNFSQNQFSNFPSQRTSGHLVENCPKLKRQNNNNHQSKSYNNNNNFQRGKKVASVAHKTEGDNYYSESSSSVCGQSLSGGISQEQLSQLIQILQVLMLWDKLLLLLRMLVFSIWQAPFLKRPLAIGKMSNGLYLLQQKSFSDAQAHNTSLFHNTLNNVLE